jgi:MYXO-CTERM domain-containing protein
MISIKLKRVSQVPIGALGLILALSSSAWGADLTEQFLSSASSGSGSKLGACKQLLVSTFGGGKITVAGNGAAAVESTLTTDAAFLSSTDPLPQTTYKVTVEVSKINFPQDTTQENGVSLLVISNTSPLAASDQWWKSYRMIGVEVDVLPDDTNLYPVYVNYWDAANIYTWNGAAWGVGDPNWKPVMSYDPAKKYTISVEKATNWYTITISSGGAQLVKATVPVPNVLPGTTEYLVVGDRLTNAFRGTMEINSVTMPTPSSCIISSDGNKDGGPGDGKAADALKLDGAASGDTNGVDAKPAIDSKPAADASLADRGALDSVADKNTRRDVPTGWDISAPDARGTPPPSSGCGCRVAERAPTPSVALAALGLLALLRRRRRR